MAERWDHRVGLTVDQGDPTLWPMEGGGLGLRRTLRRGGRDNDSPPPSYPDARRRNMMKCIAAVLIVLGMIITAGATPHAPRTWAPIYEPHRVSWAELREDLHRRKAFWRTSAKMHIYPLAPGTWYTSTSTHQVAINVFVFQGVTFFWRPATRTGTFSALG